jgi:hypothetical protein
MSTHASEELLQALSNANLRLRQLQLLPSCSGDVQLAAESVSLELEKALSLVARADSRPAPPAARTASPPAPVACVPPLVPPPSAPAEPPRAPDTPKAPPLPLAAAVRAATAPAGNDDGIPPWLANKNRQKHGGGPSPAQLAPQEFPSLASGGAASSAAAPGAWGRGRPAALAAPPRVRASAHCMHLAYRALTRSLGAFRHRLTRSPVSRLLRCRCLAACLRAQRRLKRRGDSAATSPER